MKKRRENEKKEVREKARQKKERERERFFWRSVPTLLFAVQKDTRASYT